MRRWRERLYGGSLLAVATLLAGTAGRVAAQTPQGVTDYAVPGLAAENVPIPTGNPGGHTGSTRSASS